MSLIVGLGNPGARYAQTRHNAGAWFVDALAGRLGGEFRPESRFQGETCQVSVDDQRCWLLKPLTYMNESGFAVAAMAKYLKIPMDTVLIAHDDLDLPPGVARLKRGGGHGGHNGLRDTIERCGGGDFLRLRLGIGHPGHKDDVVDYVLRPPSAAEREAIREAIDAALDALPWLVGGDLERAMQALHSRRGPAG